MKKSIFIFTFIFAFVTGFAQTNSIPKYNVPEEYSFLLREDYNKYQLEIKRSYRLVFMAFDGYGQ